MTHPNAPSGQPYSPPPPAWFRTPQEWEQAKGIRVADPDGWRGYSAGGPKDFGEPISEYEFDQRAAVSTVDQRPSYNGGSDSGGGKKRSWPARHKVLTVVLALVGAFFVLGGIGAALGGGTSSPRTAAVDPSPTQDSTTGTQLDPNYSPPESAPPAPTATSVPDKPALTKSQENAVDSAKSYLGFQGFSRVGLINQLVSFDKYTRTDATVAVGTLHVDWRAQAVRVAQSYLDLQGFSRSGLIHQLRVFDKFTATQATYAADKVGL